MLQFHAMVGIKMCHRLFCHWLGMNWLEHNSNHMTDQSAGQSVMWYHTTWYISGFEITKLYPPDELKMPLHFFSATSIWCPKSISALSTYWNIWPVLSPATNSTVANLAMDWSIFLSNKFGNIENPVSQLVILIGWLFMALNMFLRSNGASWSQPCS